MDWSEIFPNETDRPKFHAKDFGPIELPTVEAAHRFFTEEADAWSWANKPSRGALGVSEDRRPNLLNPLVQARDGFGQYLNAPQPEILTAALNEAQRYLRLGLVTKTSRAAFIQSLREQEQGDVVAGSALSTYLGSSFEANTPKENRYAVQRGQVAMAMFDNGATDATTKGAQHLTNQIVAEFTERMQRLSDEGEKRIAMLSIFFDEAKARDASSHEEREAKIAKFLQNLNDGGNEAIKSISDTEKAFMERMTLGAPVDYWKKKKERHEEAAKKRAKWLGVYAVIGSLVLLGAYVLLYCTALSIATDTNKSSAVIVLAGAAAVVTTIAFWVARLLQRLYLSERHMAIDAELRYTLVDCYLALTAAGKIDKDERPLVLPPLFRAGSDGIVNDDTNLDGIAALAARYLEKIK